MDFNVLERRATEFVAQGRYDDALAIYYHMADGDPSLDAGYLGLRIAECCEAKHDLHAARYWYGRAREEGPFRPEVAPALARLSGVTSEALL